MQSRDKDCDEFKVYHYHNNHLGTPQELTDNDGNVVWANYDYAWGGRYTHFYKEQSLNNCAIIETDLQPIRFQGQFFDTETSLHYNRFRYYDSDVGMFIQRDPIGLLGGFNVFQYAPNPIGWVDPFGLCADPTPTTKKKPPNPNGRKGGKPHQDKIAEIKKDIEERGLIASKTEHEFPTPNGRKSKRAADVVAIDPKTQQIVEIHQVGKSLKTNPDHLKGKYGNDDITPVSRERKAIDDIRSSPDYNGADIKYHPYDR